jgi:GxxExxY protein
MLVETCKEIAKQIFNELGSGFDEPIYQKAFEVELRLRHISYENIKIIPVFYKGYNVGEAKLDLFIYNDTEKIVAELKAIANNLSPKEETQIRGYLKTLNTNNGLLINFPQAGRKGVPEEPEIIDVLR